MGRTLVDWIALGLVAAAALGVAQAAHEVAAQEWLAQGLRRLPWLALQERWSRAVLWLAPGVPLLLGAVSLGAAALRRRTAAGATAAIALGAGAALLCVRAIDGLLPADEGAALAARLGAGALAAAGFVALARSARAGRALFAPRRRLRAAGALALGALAALHAGTRAAAQLAPVRGPNVVLVVVDTLRADHLGPWGYTRPTSPSLDAFARDAVVFRNAVAPAPWTTPSVAALLSSRWPSEVYAPRTPLAPERLLLAELFRDAGYDTAAFVSHLNVSAELGFDQGFAAWDQSQAQGYRHVSSPALSARASAFVARPRRAPFFLLVHYFDPHVAFQLQPGCDFDPGYAGLVQSGLDHGALNGLVRRMSPRDLEHVRALYDSEICFTDRHVGALFTRLRELGLYDDAFVVLTADHGEEFAERGRPYVGHGRHLHQELIRVPLLVKPPGGGHGRVSDAWVSLLDLAPTLAASLPRGAGAAFRGRPLPLAPGAGAARAPAPVFSENAGQHAVIAGGWKLIRQPGGTALYDIGSDPGETRDQSAREPVRVQTLAALLDDWRAGLEPVRADAAARSPFDAEQAEQLRALGYAE